MGVGRLQLYFELFRMLIFSEMAIYSDKILYVRVGSFVGYD